MLGKTNLLFVAENEAAELAFKPEYILTSSGGSITKIEYINNLFFVFTNKDEVLYGSDINKLQLIKKDGATFGAKHIIYTNNSYYLADANLGTKKAVIYKTINFTTYEEVVLKNLEDDAKVIGLFISSENEIVALIERREYAGSSTNYYYYYDLLITNSLLNYSEENAIYQNYDLGITSYSATYIPKMKKDRIFALIRHNNYGSGAGYVLSLNGKYNGVTNVYSWFASDHFFYYGGSSGVGGYPLYYSFNGIDYIRLDFSHIQSFLALNIFEYDGSIAMIYSCLEEDGKKVQKFTTSATPKGLIDATKSAIPVSIDYTMISDSELYKDDYVYLGCTGGIIIKGQIDNAEVIRPDVVVVKGMAAKEALRQANDYTDEKYKNTTKEVKECEETTRQYMENAFSATPKGYAELVDTVHENTVKINAIVDKAELIIKDTAMGDNIHLIDSADGKNVEFALYGKATQNTTSGKNRLENTATSKAVNGVTFTVNEDKSVTVNGTATDIAYINVGTYTFGEDVILSGCPSGGSATTYSLYAFGTTLLGRDIGSGVEIQANEQADIRLMVASGVTIDKTFYPMIRLASAEDDTYEPYTGGIPSPNPNYKQDIEVAGSDGSVEVKSVGKNIMVLDQSLNTDSQYFTYSSNTQELISVTVNRASKFIATLKTILKKGETYTISINASKNLAINIYSDKIWGNGVGTFGVKDNKTFTFDGESGEYIIGIYVDSSSTVGEVISLSNLQLEEGPVATEYEPYYESITEILTPNGLAGIPVSSDGNYTDSNGQQWIANEIVKYADGSGEKIQRIGKDIFDGSEDEAWNKDTKGRWYSRTLSPNAALSNSDSDNSKIPNALCNSYQPRTGGQTYEQIMGVAFQNNTFIVYDPTYGESDKTAWTTYLSSNPVTVYYELAEPIRTPLTAEEITEIEKLSTFYPVTNISNDGGCGMGITYLADSKNYINRKVAEQVASIVENIK